MSDQKRWFKAKEKYRAKGPSDKGEYKYAQRRAASAVRMAFLTGELEYEPCEICEADDWVDAHHDDYRKPLDVRFLCPRCHKKIHMGYVLV